MADKREDYRRKLEQEVFCPQCHRAHYSGYAVMDEYINCECGSRFYAFSCSGLKITMPQDEAGYEPIARAMRRFVVTTGRCSDIPPELYQDENGQYYFGAPKKEEDVEAELEQALEQFQMETFGEIILSKDVIYAICESFQDGHDVELRKQKKRVDIIKLIRKKLPIEEKRHIQRNRTFVNAIRENAMQMSFPSFGIMRTCQSQERQYLHQ